MAGNGYVPAELAGEKKASRKMINIWMLRWSAISFFMVLGLMVPFWMMFMVQYDEATGEIIDFSLGHFLLSVILCLLVTLAVSFGITRGWASLYWKSYSYKFKLDRVIITRGVIGKKVTNIQYERIQNVNVWKGILERIFGLSSVMIETAGGTQMQMANYGAFSFSEGTIQGIEDPQPMVDYLLKRAKGGKDYLSSQQVASAELTNEKKLELLEERLLKGEISEQTYRDLKAKYGG